MVDSHQPAENDPTATQPRVGPAVKPSVPFPGINDTFGLTRCSRPVEPAVDPLLGKSLGDVRILSLIGEGGMGRVYQGEQARPKRLVAVKVIHRAAVNEKSLRRFLREAEILGRLQHRGLAQIFTAGTSSGGLVDLPFVVMELVNGGIPITDHSRRHLLPLDVLLRLFCEVCAAVRCAHRNGIIHRDIKPANILVDRHGVVKVIDFGLAVSIGNEPHLRSLNTTFSDTLGTLQYMSPEQLHGDPKAIDSRSDVYALGLVLYELVIGSMPYDVANMPLHDATRAICKQAVPAVRRRARHVPRAVAAVIDRCLAKSPTARYADAGELEDAIAAIRLRQQDISSFHHGASRGGLWSSARWRGYCMAALAAITAGIGLVPLSQQREIPAKRTSLDTDPPPEWIAFNDSLYLFTEERGTLFEAITAARSRDAKLLVIDNVAENAFATAHLKGWTWLGILNEFVASHERGDAWRGFIRTGRGWSVIDGERQATFFNWLKGQPQGHLHEFGAVIHETGLWCDHFATDINYFCFERPRPSGNAAAKSRRQ